MKQRVLTISLVCLIVLSLLTLISGCRGRVGEPGANGKSGTSAATTGTLSGTVTTQVGSLPLAGVSVTTSPVVSGATGTTDASGNFTLSVPGGAYTVTFAKQYYTTATASVNVANGVVSPVSATMAESASGYPTSLTLVASGNNVGYNQAFTLTANATDPNGDTLSYVWTGATGTGSTATATSQTFASAMGGTPAPSTDPGGFVSPYVQDNRFGILPINADTRGAKAVTVKVSDGQGGSTSASVTVNSAAVQAGVRQVAVGIPVYLNSGITNSMNAVWTGTDPNAAAVTLSTAGTGTRNPWFVPAVEGAYVISSGTKTMTIYAGKFVGAITGGGYTTKTFTTANGMWYGWVPSSTSSSITYTNWPTVAADGCANCHSSAGPGSDVITPWAQTSHATFFSRGIEGITSNSNSCTTCHTVGSDGVTANNGGYDDLVASTGFKYQKNVGAWSAMTASYPTVAAVSNIQCENCHGAQGTLSGANTGHKSSGTRVSGVASLESSTVAARVSFGADICGACHSSGTGHHFFSEWNNVNPDNGMGHSKLAQIDATGYSGHARSTDGSCARCHTAQGFVAYVPQLVSGNAGTLPAASIIWTKDNAMPQTCTACHDPHSDANENQLRLIDTLPTSMAGFGVSGVGKGALCMACHNNRNGIQCASAPTGTGACVSGLSPIGKTFLHEDNDAYAPTALDSMHDASQTEVLMGRDFFFMGNSLPMLSKHAAVEDTCVGCHMALNPQTHLSHGTPAVNTHNFYITDADRPQLCANCHSSSVNGEALVSLVEDQLGVLAKKMSADLLSRLTTTVYFGSSHTAITVTSVDYFDGSFCLNGTYTAGVCSSGNTGSITNITTDVVGNFPVVGPNDKLKKASWNWTMIERDGSKGIHNPSFITSVLNNTIAQFP